MRRIGSCYLKANDRALSGTQREDGKHAFSVDANVVFDQFYLTIKLRGSFRKHIRGSHMQALRIIDSNRRRSRWI